MDFGWESIRTKIPVPGSGLDAATAILSCTVRNTGGFLAKIGMLRYRLNALGGIALSSVQEAGKSIISSVVCVQSVISKYLMSTRRGIYLFCFLHD